MKAILSLTTALVMGLIVANNIKDYANGLAYTAGAMGMEHVPDNPLKGRRITDERYHRAAYNLVIGWEALTALLCGLGGLLLLGRRSPGLRLAQAGHLAGAALFMGAFRGVAGQYFLMWRAGQMNGLPDAHRMLSWLMTVLVLLGRQDG